MLGLTLNGGARLGVATVCLVALGGLMFTTSRATRAGTTAPSEVYVLSNSISSGFCFNHDTWPQQLERLSGGKLRVFNLSVEGFTTPELVHIELPQGKVGSTVIAWECSNHLMVTRNPDLVVQAWFGWCKHLKDRGFRVVTATIPARIAKQDPEDFERKRLMVNDEIRKRWRGCADAMVDIASLPEFQRVDFPQPARFYQDYDHPTDEGAGVIAERFLVASKGSAHA